MTSSPQLRAFNDLTVKVIFPSSFSLAGHGHLAPLMENSAREIVHPTAVEKDRKWFGKKKSNKKRWWGDGACGRHATFSKLLKVVLIPKSLHMKTQRCSRRPPGSSSSKTQKGTCGGWMAVGGVCCYYDRLRLPRATTAYLRLARAHKHKTDVTVNPDDRFTCCGRDSPFSHLGMIPKRKKSFI